MSLEEGLPENGRPSHAEARKAFLQDFGSFGARVLADEVHLVDDLFSLQMAFPDGAQYEMALQEILGQLRRLQGVVLGRAMRRRLQGWRRHAFVSGAGVLREEDLRIVYRPQGDAGIELLGFGHRDEPVDLYRRLEKRLKPRRR